MCNILPGILDEMWLLITLLHFLTFFGIKTVIQKG